MWRLQSDSNIPHQHETRQTCDHNGAAASSYEVRTLSRSSLLLSLSATGECSVILRKCPLSELISTKMIAFEYHIPCIVVPCTICIWQYASSFTFKPMCECSSFLILYNFTTSKVQHSYRSVRGRYTKVGNPIHLVGAVKWQKDPKYPILGLSTVNLLILNAKAANPYRIMTLLPSFCSYNDFCCCLLFSGSYVIIWMFRPIYV